MNIVLADQYIRDETRSRIAEADRARLVREARGPRRWGARRAARDI